MYFLPCYQNISKLNMEHSVKLEMEVLKKIAVAVHVLQRTQIWVISRCCSADLHKEIYKDFLPTCKAVVLLIKSFVSCHSRRRRFRCRGFLKLPIQKCALCFWLPVVSRTIGTQSVELSRTLTKKVCFPC